MYLSVVSAGDVSFNLFQSFEANIKKR